MFNRLNDGTIVDQNGKIILFSQERYLNDIASGKCCFICGLEDDGKFNQEHVIPDWIIRRHQLINGKATISNNSSFPYRQYKTPCCPECNSLMGKIFEDPISDLFTKGPEHLVQNMRENGPWMIFIWLCLIFFKLHHKDAQLRLYQDNRMPDEKISSLYSWEELYHVHIVARSFYTESNLMNAALGSLFVLPAASLMSSGEFDFADLTAGRVIMLRLGKVAIVAVLDDSCAVMHLMQDKLKKIKAPLSEIQLREFCAECAFLNIHLRDRPVFKSEIDMIAETHTIIVDRPEFIELSENIEISVRGLFLHRLIEDALPHLETAEKRGEELRDAIIEGKITFLFDDDGAFIVDPRLLEDGWG